MILQGKRPDRGSYDLVAMLHVADIERISKAWKALKLAEAADGEETQVEEKNHGTVDVPRNHRIAWEQIRCRPDS
jgi:hypothetical protein